MSAKYTNTSNVSLAIAVYLASDYYDFDNDPNTISATVLLKPLRQIVIPSRLPDGVGLPDLSGMVKSRLGVAFHDAVEKAWMNNYKPAMLNLGYPQKVIDTVRINPTKTELELYKEQGMRIVPIYLEQRLSKQLGKWKVTGKFDFIGEGKVQDFKSTSTFSYTSQSNAKKYIEQGSIYRWLGQEIITQDVMEIHYLFTDWKSGMVKNNPKYPPSQVFTQTFPLMTVKETENFISNKLNAIESNWNRPEDQLPHCNDEELWRKEPVFKYYKNPAKTTKSTRNFKTKQEAYIQLAKDKNVGIVREFGGEVVACKYCPAFAGCSQKDELIASHQLVL